MARFLYWLILNRRERGEFSTNSRKLTNFSVRMTHTPEMVLDSS